MGFLDKAKAAANELAAKADTALSNSAWAARERRSPRRSSFVISGSSAISRPPDGPSPRGSASASWPP